MTTFSEILQKINEIPYGFNANNEKVIQDTTEALQKLLAECTNGKSRGREAASRTKAIHTLQSIDEDEDPKATETKSARNSTSKDTQRSNKRSKDQVDDMASPEQDKRPKRNASVGAQSVISQQVNVNLTQKMRREDSSQDVPASRSRRKDDGRDKENTAPVKVKQEKVSLLPTPMDCDTLPSDSDLSVQVKQESDKDDIAMPPPMAPAPKTRRGAKTKEKTEDSGDESNTSKRSTRNKKETAAAPVPAPRSTRASSRASARNANTTQTEEMPPPEPRPKRTRAKKKDVEAEQDTTNDSSAPTSPAEKPRPKRTRRGKGAEKEQEKPQAEPPKSTEPEPIEEPIIPKQERISEPIQNVQSPKIQLDNLRTNEDDTENNKYNTENNKYNKESDKYNTENNKYNTESDKYNTENDKYLSGNAEYSSEMNKEQDNAQVANSTVTLSNVDTTVVLPSGKYDHAPITPEVQMNETVVLEKRDTLDKASKVMDSTVVISKVQEQPNITDDNSIMTDDNSDQDFQTPPTKTQGKSQPMSAVKEKVQQFEEMASRVTRTKTRAMAKKEESSESETPPDKIVKQVLSSDTLKKMNNLIFNGKAPQTSSSASKPRSNIVTSVKSFIPSSTSKIASIAKAKEEMEVLAKEKDAARNKKKAMLEAKREMERKKREEKMAAAAAARSAAEKFRLAALEAAQKEKQDKQAHADLNKLERLKEADRKKQDLARKVAETEERRRAEEKARQLKLAEEQRQKELARKKQQEESEAVKREAALMAKEIEKRQREYLEKQKLKQKIEASKMTTPIRSHTLDYPSMEPVHMADGFEHLNSDSDDESAKRLPVPAWSTSKARWNQLTIQAHIKPAHIDRLFSVRVHSPDLRAIFPNIDRRALKRTSSAVWRTPPTLQQDNR